MVDEGPPVAQPPPVIPPVVCPAPPVQLAVPPIVPPIQPFQPTPMPQLNWSHLKPEFAGKPDEDAEAHLLTTMPGWTPMLSIRCQSPEILFNISR